ncbi:MAG UNVERIFIED_CONTAM: tetratricopeptide repeat protein [Planctomycetaceae bacterium]
MTLTQQMGLHERAAEHAQNLLQTAPDDPAMLTAAAEVLAECGRSELAATALEAALKRQPDAPATALALASLLAEQGQTSRALDVCRSALEHTTENRSRNELARLLAELYQQLGSPSDVLQWLESRTAEADDTARGGWLRTLTEVHKSSGQTTLARRTLERCLQLDGPDPAVLLELSELALQQRDPQSAVSSLQQILRRRTGSHRLSSNAGPRTPRRICREQSAEDGGHPATARNQRSRRSPRSAPAAAKIQRSKRGCRGVAQCRAERLGTADSSGHRVKPQRRDRSRNARLSTTSEHQPAAGNTFRRRRADSTRKKSPADARRSRLSQSGALGCRLGKFHPDFA